MWVPEENPLKAEFWLIGILECHTQIWEITQGYQQWVWVRAKKIEEWNSYVKLTNQDSGRPKVKTKPPVKLIVKIGNHAQTYW